jgi:hypothetical protein
MQSIIAYMTHGSITASLWDDLHTVEGNIALNLTVLPQLSYHKLCNTSPWFVMVPNNWSIIVVEFIKVSPSCGDYINPLALVTSKAWATLKMHNMEHYGGRCENIKHKDTGSHQRNADVVIKPKTLELSLRYTLCSSNGCFVLFLRWTSAIHHTTKQSVESLGCT